MSTLISNTQLQWYCQINDYDSIIRHDDHITVRKPLPTFPDLHIDIIVGFDTDRDGNKTGLYGILSFGCCDSIYTVNLARIDENHYPWREVYHDLFQQLNMFASTLQGMKKVSDLTVA